VVVVAEELILRRRLRRRRLERRMRVDHPIDTSQPAHEMPHWPTRPLLFGTFFTSQSIVSQVSVASFGVVEPCTYGTWCTNSPSDLNFPRASW
jgi:hypothetical protein